jgi:dinuclear metal center YbgI/SA1388 family protein
MLPFRRLSFKFATTTSPLRKHSVSSSQSISIMASPFTRAVVQSMRKLYPESLADKSFDNTGLLLEAPFFPARRNKNSVLLTIDLTKAVAEEAIQQQHSVVVAYHPIIFRGLKSITLNDSQQESLLKLAAHGVSVYSPHTAVDIVPGGMGDWLCDIVTGKLDDPEPRTVTVDPVDAESGDSATDVTTSEETSDVEPVSAPSTKPATPSASNEIDPFTSSPADPTTPKPQPPKKKRRPLAHRTYSKPSYPNATASFHPASLSHTRSVITPSPSSDIESANAFTSSSLYTSSNTGAGRVIKFSTAQPLTLLITRIAHAIGLPKGFPVAIPQGTNVEDVTIKTVGVCPGSGASVMRACTPPPDLVFTGEMSHHEALAITERGGCVVSLFHSNSERGYLRGVMRDKLQQKVEEVWSRERKMMKESGGGKVGFGDGVEEILEDESVLVHVSERDRDPFGIVVLMESEVQGVELTPEENR